MDFIQIVCGEIKKELVHECIEHITPNLYEKQQLHNLIDFLSAMVSIGKIFDYSNRNY